MELGGWKYLEEVKACELPDRVAEAFTTAMQGLVGCKYTPVYYVAYQVVHGKNYCVICHSRTATEEPKFGCKAVYINAFTDEDGKLKVHIVKIEDVIR